MIPNEAKSQFQEIITHETIEHEDLALPPIDGVRQSVALLRRVITSAAWGLGQ